MMVKVKFRQVGYHYWPGARGRRSYLGHRHRHEFHVTAGVEVLDADRQIETHDLLDLAFAGFLAISPGEDGEFGSLSCEQLADRLAHVLLAHWPDRFVMVEVLEDGQTGAAVSLGADRVVLPECRGR